MSNYTFSTTVTVKGEDEDDDRINLLAVMDSHEISQELEDWENEDGEQVNKP